MGGATGASVCLQSMGEAERQGEGWGGGVKAQSAEKHLRVKFQSVEKTENQKHTRRQRRVRPKNMAALLNGAQIPFYDSYLHNVLVFQCVTQPILTDNTAYYILAFL